MTPCVLSSGQFARVGELGPEIIRAPQGGARVIPSSQVQQQQEPPTVIVNILADPQDAINALDSGEGDRVIVAAIERTV